MDKIIILRNGTKIPVIKEDSKYLYCDGTQFRKNHPDIVEVKKGKIPEEGFEKLPDLDEIEKEIESEEKMIENLSAKPKTQAKKKPKKGE